MVDFSSLKLKVNALKAKIEQSSITPISLGSILDDFIILMQAIDMTDMSEDIQTAIGNASDALLKSIQALTTSQSANNIATEAQNLAIQVLSGVNSIIESKGQPQGIAPLDTNGLIPTRFIPGAMDDVKEFEGFVEGVAIQMQGTYMTSKDEGCSVVFDTQRNTFLLHVIDILAGGVVSFGTYYDTWGDRGLFCQTDEDGEVIPHSDKVYVDKTTNRSYRWGGSRMSVIGSDLALGYTPSTAFPGDEGNQLQIDMEDAKTDISHNSTAIADLKKDVSIVRFHGIAESPFALTGGVIFYFSELKAFYYSTGSTAESWTPYNDYNVQDGSGVRPKVTLIFRKGNELYRWNNDRDDLVKIGALADSEDIEVDGDKLVVTERAKRAVFDDLWISAGYVHNKQYSSIDRKNHPESPYILNGIPHTYEEALYTYNQSVVGYGGDLSGMYYQRSRLKTIFPIHFGALLGSKATNMFNGCSNIENIVLSTNYCNPSEISGMFSGCIKLRIVSGIIATSYLTWTTYINTTFQNCSSLEDFRIQNIKGSLDIHWSPKLSYETISYLVTSKTSTTVATITVHPDVYSKLTGDETSEAYNDLTDEKKAQWTALVETAAEKNIQFATA